MPSDDQYLEASFLWPGRSEMSPMVFCQSKRVAMATVNGWLGLRAIEPAPPPARAMRRTGR
jgi:hypothetical protein